MTSPFFTFDKLNLPFMSVTVPFVVPFTTTEAPVTGPNSSSMVPVIFSACCVIEVSVPTSEAYTFPPKERANDSSRKLTVCVFFSIIVSLILFKLKAFNSKVSLS